MRARPDRGDIVCHREVLLFTLNTGRGTKHAELFPFRSIALSAVGGTEEIYGVSRWERVTAARGIAMESSR